MGLSVSVVTEQSTLSSLRSDWDALLVRAGNDLPFMLLPWLDVWWTHFHEEGRVEDELSILLVRDGNELVGALPLMITHRRVGPVHANIYSFLGADPYITELRTPLVDPDYAVDVAQALADHLLARRDWDWIDWSGIARGSPFASALERALPMEWTSELSANVVRLPPTWEELKKGLKRNIKESLRHCYNSLKRDGLVPRLVVARSPSEVASALEIFFRLHSSRSELKDTIAHPDRFASHTARSFLEDLCARLSAEGTACVFLLYVNDAVVAVRIAFILPKGMYLYYSGFDPAYGKYSVATTIVAEAMQWAIDQKLEVVHLSTGTDTSKSRWGPQETTFHDAITIAPRTRSHALHGAAELTRRARARPELRALVERFAPIRSFE